MAKRLYPAGAALLLCLLMVLAGCGAGAEAPATEGAAIHIVTPVAATAEPAEEPLSFLPLENRAGELVFAVTGQELIEAFNAQYGSALLPGLEKWRQTVCESAPNSPYETICCLFQAAEGVTVSPAVRLYIPADSDYTGQLVLTFDHHGYADWAYSLYKELCCCMLKMLLPDIGTDGAATLFQTLYGLAVGEPACYFDEPLGTETVTPPLLYWKDGVGLYPCYAAGLVYLCAVPVTEAYLEGLATLGAEVYEIE